MTLNIDNPALIILIISTGLIIFISFIKYAFETITLETLYLWRKEEQDGISRLENLIQNQNRSISTFSILKLLSLIISISTLNIYYFREYPYSPIEIVSINIIAIIFIGAIESIILCLTMENGPLFAHYLIYLSDSYYYINEYYYMIIPYLLLV